MKKFLLLIAAIYIIIILYENTDLKLATANSLGIGNKIQTETVCFSRDILPIFVQYCAKSGCHDVQTHEKGLVLDNYSSIINKINPGTPDDSEIYLVMTSGEQDDRMPPANKQQPSQPQLDLIRLWILQGANNTDCSNEPCDTSNVTFSVNIKPIIQNNCIGCHSGTNPSGAINFSNDGVILNMKSKIYGSLAHLDGYIPMPPSYNINNCYLAQIRIWVTGDNNQPCDTSNVSYSGTIKQILQSQCISCHSGANPPKGLDFTNEVTADNSKTRIYGAVAGLTGYTSMPPGFRIDTCSIKKIRIWAFPVNNEPCDTTNFTYSFMVKPILAGNCMSCHSGIDAPLGLDFSNDNIAEQNKKRLYCAVSGGIDCSSMPPNTAIDSCSIFKIKVWSDMPMPVNEFNSRNYINLNIFPNPAKSILNISYELTETEDLVIEIYDTQGKEIYYKRMNKKEPGHYYENIILEGIIPQGIYILRVKAGKRTFDKFFNYIL